MYGMTGFDIVTSEQVTKEALKEWVLSFPDSIWNDGAFGGKDALVMTGAGSLPLEGRRFYLSGDTEMWPYYEPEEMIALAKALGAPPVSELEISYSARNQSVEAETKLAQLILAKWKGVLVKEVIGHSWAERI